MTEDKFFHKSVQEVREEKLEKIRRLGEIAYKDRGEKTDVIKNILDSFDLYEGNEIVVCGRLMAKREHGRAAFADIRDDSAQMQLHIREDILGENEFEFFDELVDIGDFVEARGKAFETKRGEKSIEVSEYKLLSKSLSQLPEKWKGLQDIEKKHRYRYLDLLMDDGLRNRFRLRAKTIDALREFMKSRNFLEVETPTLQNSAGGALAKPFKTHYNAYDIDVKLRISLEIPLKKLILGGYEKVYEIGRVYRNEGKDPSHLQEFTMFEFYWAYVNYEDLMELTEQMMREVIEKTLGNMIVNIDGQKIDMTPPYLRKTIFELIKEYGGHDLSGYKTAEDLRDFIKQAGIEIEEDIAKLEYGKLIDEIYKKVARPKVKGPVFVIDHPIELSPLARKKDDDPSKVDRFQLIVNGWEICNAYSELVDPLDQEERFRLQQLNKAKGDAEAHDYDHEYIEAMRYGMPPIAGWGMGIDRFMSVLTGIDNVREMIVFPYVKPKDLAKTEHLVVDKVDTSDRPVKLAKDLIDDLDKQTTTDKLTENILDDKQLEKLSIETMGISRADALELMNDNLENVNLRKHSQAVEAILRGVALEVGADEDVWGIAGLLHDIDYEKTMKEPTKHCIITEGILKEKRVSPLIIQAIKAHNPACGAVRKTRLDKAIYAVDPLSGFVIACAMVMPDKKLESVTMASMKKKFKDRSFAKGADREIISSCKELGIKLDRFLEIGLEALSKINAELGL
ncbi:lysine--tRNA ligase [Patescibacteria group bacterium]|nr:lysine--tRNA ligase [Patescibacteria group bacterium]